MKNNTLKDAQADIEGLDMLKDELYESKGEPMMTNDDTRDIAIRCVDRLVLEGYVKDCVDTNDTTEFSVQDIIHEEINKALKGTTPLNRLLNEACEIITELESDDSDERIDRFFKDVINLNEKETAESGVCPTCDQHPYGDADDMCPVCGHSIGESVDVCPKPSEVGTVRISIIDDEKDAILNKEVSLDFPFTINGNELWVFEGDENKAKTNLGIN